MKKLWLMFIFIFLTGLFSGIFFSGGLSSENSTYLSSMMISGMRNTSGSLFSSTMSVFTSNFLLVLIMLPAVFTKYLCPLPLAILWYKSFAVGFCSGLVYESGTENPFFVSLLKLLPQNMIFIPAFILISGTLFLSSIAGGIKNSRILHHDNRNLLYITIAVLIMMMLGSIIESLFRLIEI